MYFIQNHVIVLNLAYLQGKKLNKRITNVPIYMYFLNASVVTTCTRTPLLSIFICRLYRSTFAK